MTASSPATPPAVKPSSRANWRRTLSQGAHAIPVSVGNACYLVRHAERVAVAVKVSTYGQEVLVDAKKEDVLQALRLRRRGLFHVLVSQVLDTLVVG